MAAPQVEEPVSLKLLVNKETNKVLFAEAGKDFVDVLCSFLTLPLGTIARLALKESAMGPVTVGCLNSLYQNVANLDENCLWTVPGKEMFLKPWNSSDHYCRTLKLDIDDTEPQKYFTCTWFQTCRNQRCLSTSPNELCHCGNLLSSSVNLKSLQNGFVNGVATFIITDDLIIMPNSVDHTSFGPLQNLEVKCLSSMKEMTVKVTKGKVLDLLKCCLLSKSTLTDLFLRKKPFFERSRYFPCRVEEGSNSFKIKVKLVMRKSDGKILFAQGEEDFADFLFSFLTFPLGAVVRVLGGNSSVGSLDGLYKSIADLNEDKYLMSKELKCRLIDPRIPPPFRLSKQILPIDESYTAQYYCYHQSSGCRKIYPKAFMESDEGYVKGPALFMATDDLVVVPASPISVISLLQRLETLPSDLTEKFVIIGVKEAFNLLKAALTSTSALTNGLGHLLTEVKEEN